MTEHEKGGDEQPCQRFARYATEGPEPDGVGGFAGVKIDRLNVAESGAWRKPLRIWHKQERTGTACSQSGRPDLNRGPLVPQSNATGWAALARSVLRWL